jgi:hypothetical protein
MFYACIERFDVMGGREYFGLGWGSEQDLNILDLNTAMVTQMGNGATKHRQVRDSFTVFQIWALGLVLHLE